MKKNIVIGIVSGGRGECYDRYPDVYTKVSHFLDFIDKEMNYFTDHPNEAGEHQSVWDV